MKIANKPSGQPIYLLQRVESYRDNHAVPRATLQLEAALECLIMAAIGSVLQIMGNRVTHLVNRGGHVHEVYTGFSRPTTSAACQSAFTALKAPIRMVTPPHTPVPFAPKLEDAYIPSPEKIEAAVREVAAHGR